MTQSEQFTAFEQHLSNLSVKRSVGRVSAVEAGVIHVAGFENTARIGDRVQICSANTVLDGEVVQLKSAEAIILTDASLEGVGLDDKVFLASGGQIRPHNSWLGRVIDPFGRPLDGRPLTSGLYARALRASPPDASRRRPLGERLDTGHVVFDTMLPLAKGQRIGLFAGSGVGKSTLMGRLAEGVAADVAVIALIGERGRELRHFIDDVLGPKGRARSVVVAATSDQSPLLRRRCAWSAMCVAEHFRDQGRSVLFVADSITRFAEAHREVAVAAGEAPVLRGYPPSTAHMIMSLCERSGPGTDGQGDITGIFSVLVPGSDMEEPVADILRGVLDGHVVLDRQIAERGRFPAIDILRSVSRSLPGAASSDENALIAQVRRHMSIYTKNEVMISAGLYARGSDPEIDAAIQVWQSLDDAMAVTHRNGIAHSFTEVRRALHRSGKGFIGTNGVRA